MARKRGRDGAKAKASKPRAVVTASVASSAPAATRDPVRLGWRDAVVVGIVFVASLSTRIFGLSFPPYVVFDETHFAGFISDYLRGVSFFDIHPPLAKQIMTGIAWVSGYRGQFNASVGAPFIGPGSEFYIPMRQSIAVVGALVPVMVTLTLLLNRVDRVWALAGGILVGFDFVGISQSRFIFTDSFLYLFVAFTLFTGALYENYPTWTVLFVQSVGAACSFSTKYACAPVFVVVAYSHISVAVRQGGGVWRVLRRVFVAGAVNGAMIVIVLWATCALHFQMLPNPGFGDQYYQRDFRSLPLMVRVRKMIWAMYTYSRDLGFTHPHQSRWYEWALGTAEPLHMYTTPPHFIVMFNSPVSVVFSSLGGAAGILWGFVSRGYFGGYGVGWAVTWLMFVFVSRCTFVYHYFISLMCGVLAGASLLGRVGRVSVRFVLAVAFVGLAAAALWWWAPWVYGLGRSAAQHRALALPWWPGTRANWPENPVRG